MRIFYGIGVVLFLIVCPHVLAAKPVEIIRSEVTVRQAQAENPVFSRRDHASLPEVLLLAHMTSTEAKVRPQRQAACPLLELACFSEKRPCRAHSGLTTADFHLSLSIKRLLLFPKHYFW